MCGLAGYVGVDSERGRSLLQRMADLQAHRGPDGEGFFIAGQIGLAHRRLAVIDRAGGEQPMCSAYGRYVLVYNGEVYNFRELRAELGSLGCEFHTHSDTEVVLAAWTRWGHAAFERFNGMFALAIADTQTGQVILARDHFGIKPLYLASDGAGRTVFASEIRPLLASGVVQRRPDDVTIYRYLRFRVHDDTERTFFAGITRLLPGECATITPDGKVHRATYTRLFAELPELAARPRPYDGAARTQFAIALRTAIRSRLVSDVPVGTALSGGLDSSTVVATINELLADSDTEAVAVGDRQQTFSAVFPGELNDEERYVDAVAARCADLRVHKVKPSADEFLVDLTDFIRTQEEPVISTGPYAQYCVMREASKHVTVMVDGQGADEMMAGYVPYYLVNLRDLRRRGHAGRAAGELSRSLDVLWRLGRFRAVDTVLRRRRAPITALLSRDFVSIHKGQQLAVNPDNLKARLVDDIFRHSLPALLRYEDRNTMRFSVEGRVPFLDIDLLRLLWGLDESAIVQNGWNKWALRDATRGLLPQLVNRRRNKIGFTTPEDAWFTRIKNYVYEVFASDSFAGRPYFNAEAVRDAFRTFLSGRGGADTMTFWRLLNVELWLREFIDKDPTSTVDAAPTGLHGGRHPQAPPKSDYQPNPGKEIVLAGGRWARYPLRVDLVAPGDDVAALAARRTTEFFAGTHTAPAGRWYLYVGEKVVAIAQGRSYFTWDVHPGPWARTLSRFVVRTPYGIGLGHPVTMHLAIQEVGLPRILLASAAGAAGKAVGRRGLFYRIAGPAVRAIDGPTEYSAYPANVSAKLAPADPAGAARQISAAVRAAVPDDVAARFGGTVIIDANDIGRNILGHDTGLPEETLAAAFADNPLGQGREQTPLAVVVDFPVSTLDGVTGTERWPAAGGRLSEVPSDIQVVREPSRGPAREPA
ncbi:MAG TPA: asparagine synthase (glutamine-hydrolyzing) [Micromonosporaceae bacterium]|nr:asparagine synthase (glutamine-hydrolyzing) [Micromonosporaceae bacterium]